MKEADPYGSASFYWDKPQNYFFLTTFLTAGFLAAAFFTTFLTAVFGACLITAWAAASRAMGTLNGEQLT